MEKIGLFPGSFDPVTTGHVELIERGGALFDKLVVALGVNSSKQTMFPLEERRAWLETLFADHPRVEVRAYEDLTVRFMQEIGAQYLLRGLRNVLDLEYERAIQRLNRHLDAGIDTLYLISSPGTAHISSTMIREILKFGGSPKGLVPDAILADVEAAAARMRG